VTEKKSSARERRLSAGVSLYHELEPPVLFRGLHPKVIAQSAGLSRTSFYQQWESISDYWADLAHHVLLTGLRSDDPVVVTDPDYLPNITGTVASVRDTIRTTFLRDFDSMDPSDFMVVLGLASKAEAGSQLSQLLGDHYRSWTEKIYPVAQAGLDAWHREPRPPFDLRQVLAVIVVLLDGFALRRLIDPEPVNDEVLVSMVLLVVVDLTRPIGDPTTVDDLTAAIEDFPRTGPQDDQPS
jgi:AcrR family transcriptional regulator